jgi:hypothetical protein
MKKLLLLFFPAIIIFSANAQTNVGGGIYSNTTWTLVGSPYIIVDTAVVFPAVTLTIEPGVLVKFEDNLYLEIRGNLIASGTLSDSIIFTSSSALPHGGIWDGIRNTSTGLLTFDYCNFRYGQHAVSGHCNVKHSLFENNYDGIFDNGSQGWSIIDSSLFINNNSGVLRLFGNASKCRFENNLATGLDIGYGNVDDCVFINNYSGLTFQSSGGLTAVTNSTFCSNVFALSPIGSSPDTIISCNFSENHVGISYGQPRYMTGNIFSDNDTALIYISLENMHTISNNSIFHNKVGFITGGYFGANFLNNTICNNAVYNLVYSSSINGIFPNVCWCDTDSASIAVKIYDGYDDITLGLLDFTPLIACDSSALTGITPINCTFNTGIESITLDWESEMVIFPNPTTNTFTINYFLSSENSLLNIYTVLGKNVYSGTINNQSQTIIKKFSPGIYFVNVTDGKKQIIKKLIVQ